MSTFSATSSANATARTNPHRIASSSSAILSLDSASSIMPSSTVLPTSSEASTSYTESSSSLVSTFDATFAPSVDTSAPISSSGISVVTTTETIYTALPTAQAVNTTSDAWTSSVVLDTAAIASLASASPTTLLTSEASYSTLSSAEASYWQSNATASSSTAVPDYTTSTYSAIPSSSYEASSSSSSESDFATSSATTTAPSSFYSQYSSSYSIWGSESPKTTLATPTSYPSHSATSSSSSSEAASSSSSEWSSASSSSTSKLSLVRSSSSTASSSAGESRSATEESSSSWTPSSSSSSTSWRPVPTTQKVAAVVSSSSATSSGSTTSYTTSFSASSTASHSTSSSTPRASTSTTSYSPALYTPSSVSESTIFSAPSPATTLLSSSSGLLLMTLSLPASGISDALYSLAPTTISGSGGHHSVAYVPSLVIKPVITATPTPSAATSAYDSGNNFFNFLHSLGSSPISIALTVIVILGICAIIAATVAFLLRRSRRRAYRNFTMYGAERTGGYEDAGSSRYSDTPRPVHHVALHRQGSQGTYSDKEMMEEREGSVSEIWSRASLDERRRSSTQQYTASEAAQSSILEPRFHPLLLGSAPSQELVAARPEYAPSTASSSLLMPPNRPLRPASLTSSFQHAVDQAYPHSFAVPVPVPAIPAQFSYTVDSSPETHTVGLASMAAGILSPNTQRLHDEERGDAFTPLPSRAKSLHVEAASRKASMVSFMSDAPSRKMHQQMPPSRFSVTTIATEPRSSLGGASSVYGDWQIRHAQRQAIAVGQSSTPGLHPLAQYQITAARTESEATPSVAASTPAAHEPSNPFIGAGENDEAMCPPSPKSQSTASPAMSSQLSHASTATAPAPAAAVEAAPSVSSPKTVCSSTSSEGPQPILPLTIHRNMSLRSAFTPEQEEAARLIKKRTMSLF